ncbi:hypothetical protein ACIQMJ_14115 [Actinosynnema sp. NPDC091369]
MFRSKREAEELRARVADLERQVATLSAQLSATRPLLDDATRIESLARQAEAAVRSLEARATPLGVGGTRTRPKLDTLYRADVLGYVSVYFVTGHITTVKLTVGTENPPTTVVGIAAGAGDSNSYAGAIVRPGEYWIAATRGDRTDYGFELHFTPLY